MYEKIGWWYNIYRHYKRGRPNRGWFYKEHSVGDTVLSGPQCYQHEWCCLAPDLADNFTYSLDPFFSTIPLQLC